jgi:hypothetical protein
MSNKEEEEKIWEAVIPILYIMNSILFVEINRVFMVLYPVKLNS